MNKENKNKSVPKLRFPKFTNENTWTEKKLSEVLFEHGERSTGVEEVFSVSVHKGVINQIEHLGRSFSAASTDNYKRVLPGDIIYTKSPTGDFPFGIIKQSKVSKAVIVSPLYGVFKPETTALGEILDAYFEYPSNTFNYLVSIIQKGAKNTININNDTFLSKSLILPIDKNEQQKIADCFSSLDDLNTAEKQKLEELKTYKKGLMQNLFPAEGETVPKMRFKEFENSGEWEYKPLLQVAKPVTTRANNLDTDNVLTLSAEYGIVLQSTYFGKKIAGEATERYFKIARNDFVYNDRTTKSFTYGTIKRLKKYESGIVSPIYKCFRFNKEEDPGFWEYYFESGIHEAELHNLINEGARTGRFNISIDKFLSTSAWSPKPLEQQKIADCLSSLDDLITSQSQKIKALKEHKKGLLQGLFPTISEIKNEYNN